MRKLVVGIVIAVVLAVGGYYGALFWVQRSAEHEVDAMLASWRAGVGPATRGPVQYDLWTRTLKVADLALQSNTTPPVKMTIAGVTAFGIDRPAKAERIDLTDWEVSGMLPGQSAIEFTQKAPRITIEGYSGPATVPGVAEVTSPLDLLRLAMRQLAAVNAASISVPVLAAKITPAQPIGALAASEYTYSNVHLRDIRDGRVASISVDGATLASEASQPALGKMTGEIGPMTASDFDANAMAALLDPAGSKDDNYRQVYRQVSMGPYTVKFSLGGSMRLESATMDDVSFKPSRLSVTELLALAEVQPVPGRPPAPEQMRAMLDKMAGLYEGMRVGRFEAGALHFNIPPGGAVKVAGMRLDSLENGRLGEFVIEGLETQAPRNEPVSIGRLALKGLDMSKLLRVSAQLTSMIGPPTNDQLAGLLAALEGIELESVSVPDKKSAGVINVESFRASWGQFVGVMPTVARVSARMSGPISALDPQPFRALAESGQSSVRVSIDFGTTWNEKTRVYAMSPMTVEVGNVLSAVASASINNAPPEIFSTDSTTMMLALEGLEAGEVEFSLRDLGGLDLAIAQLAKTQGTPPEAARATLLEGLAQNAQARSQSNPEIQPVSEAVARFIQTKGETLTLKLVPKGRVSLMQLVKAGGADPVASLLAGFTIEAKAGR